MLSAGMESCSVARCSTPADRVSPGRQESTIELSCDETSFEGILSDRLGMSASLDVYVND